MSSKWTRKCGQQTRGTFCTSLRRQNYLPVWGLAGIGALTEVLGGTCVVANFCPAKFACIGCAGNAPDPDKRYQIERKLAWAKEQAAWAAKENLLAEERQMKHLVQDCELMVEEMDLIDSARKDAAQSVTVEHEKRSS